MVTMVTFTCYTLVTMVTITGNMLYPVGTMVTFKDNTCYTLVHMVTMATCTFKCIICYTLASNWLFTKDLKTYAWLQRIYNIQCSLFIIKTPHYKVDSDITR